MAAKPSRAEISRVMRHLARIKSPARAKASRANGAKGGRPRKKVVDKSHPLG